MVGLFRIIVLTCSVAVFSSTSVSAAEMTKCSECGMTVDVTSKFASKSVLAEKTLYFCDIGDMFSYMKRTRQDGFRAEVKDYKTGEWIDAHAAYYVHAEKKLSTPMGWGIAAFKDKKDAGEFGAVMDFDATAKALK